MRSPAPGTNWLPLACAGALVVCIGASAGCTDRDAHGSTSAPASAPDANSATRPRPPQAVAPDGATKGPSEPTPAPQATRADPNDPRTDPAALVGLTRAKLRARRGPPTEVRGKEWIYTPDQHGCREEIVSEVIVFKGDVVTSVKLQRIRTHKVCRR